VYSENTDSGVMKIIKTTYFYDGKTHREEYSNVTMGGVAYKVKTTYFSNGETHREDCPFDDGIFYPSTKIVEVKQFYPSGELKATMYLNESGMLSREDGPAYTEYVEGTNGKVIRFNAYLLDGNSFEKNVKLGT
jgi:hypothetical protein